MKKLIPILCLCFLIACRKEKNDSLPFPAETQEGLNTFGCYVDDKAFIPSMTLFGNVRPITVHYWPGANFKGAFLSIQGIDARYSLDFAGNVLIQKLKVFGTGEYPLTHVFNCADPYECDGGGYYNPKEGKTYFIESGKLTLTKLDTVNKIISGRFYFTSKDSLGNQKQIRNGVFDTRYGN